jgi:hypothetical protein
MGIFRPVIDHQAMALSLRQPHRRIPGVKAFSVDAPPFEAGRVRVRLFDDQRDGFIGLRNRTALSEDGVIPPAAGRLSSSSSSDVRKGSHSCVARKIF